MSRQNDYASRSFIVVLITVVCVVACQAYTRALAAPQPGEDLEVRAATPSGPLAIRFHYCPPGQVMRGRPQSLPEATGDAVLDRLKRDSLLAEMKGFYIGETEVSQQQFERVLGKQAIERIFKVMVAGEAEGRGEEFPVRGVSVVDAARFCQSLGDLDGQNKEANSTIEARRFRLPTHDEWQYACRAIADVEQTLRLPHFSVWPDLKDVPDDVIADCQDVWKKKLNESAAFVGSQDQVVRVIESHDSPRRGVEILSAFLRIALGTERNYASAEIQPRLVSSGRSNGWKILNMHGNVFEWTIAERSKVKFDEVWRLLVAGDEAALSSDASKLFFLAGGSYNHALDQNVGDWITFSIWGGQPMKDGVADAYSFSDLQSQNIVQDTPPGFRVLLERVLAPGWLLVIREATVMNDKDDLGAIQKQLGEHRRLVAELSTGTDRDIAEARISFYEALENYRKGNRGECAKLLTSSGDVLAREDSFFSYFQQVIQADAK